MGNDANASGDGSKGALGREFDGSIGAGALKTLCFGGAEDLCCGAGVLCA